MPIQKLHYSNAFSNRTLNKAPHKEGMITQVEKKLSLVHFNSLAHFEFLLKYIE